MTEHGEWIKTCLGNGERKCGVEWYVRDLQWVKVGTSECCSGSTPAGLGDDVYLSVATEAGWCGCGDHDYIDRLMCAYLSAVEKRRPLRNFLLPMAYLASHLGWTDHGSSIYSAWLTDRGENVLAILRNGGKDK